MRNKILATGYHAGGLNAILPVIKMIRTDGKLEVMVLGHETEGYRFAFKRLDEEGIAYKRITDYRQKDVSKQSTDAIIAEEKPALVLTGTSAQDENNSDLIEQNITLSAREKNIPVIAVLDYWANYAKRFSDINSEQGGFRFMPDKIAIMDEYALNEMLKEGFLRENLVITGNPHFDSLEKKANEFPVEKRSTLRESIMPGKKTILFYAGNTWKSESSIAGYWDLDNINIIQESLNQMSAEERNKIGVLVKLHPGTPQEDRETVRKYIDGRCQNLYLAKSFNSQELLLMSDVTLTPTSTLGIEAAMMGKPCISLQPGNRGKDPLAIITERGIIDVGYDQEYCVDLVKKAALDPRYRMHLAEKTKSFRSDGKATERIAELIYHTI